MKSFSLGQAYYGMLHLASSKTEETVATLEQW